MSKEWVFEFFKGSELSFMIFFNYSLILFSIEIIGLILLTSWPSGLLFFLLTLHSGLCGNISFISFLAFWVWHVHAFWTWIPYYLAFGQKCMGLTYLCTFLVKAFWAMLALRSHLMILWFHRLWSGKALIRKKIIIYHHSKERWGRFPLIW